MNAFTTKAATALALGGGNIARAASYRIGVKLGLNPVRRLRAVGPCGPFFAAVSGEAPPHHSVSSWRTSAQLFSRWPYAVANDAPDWLANSLTGRRVDGVDREWWEIPDFDPTVGDIKLIWELSRMDWVLALAQHARGGDAAALSRLNNWLADWCKLNPPYRGPNWKCGQEASIRVMHLAIAALMLQQVKDPVPSLRDLIQLHLQRIAPTIQYAVAQDNNHGTSEAAALFIGGSWLAAQGVRDGVRWQRQGRKWLENRMARLIGLDGSFSQYSLNYHRMVVDTVCMVEVWRRHMELPEFSVRWQQRAKAASLWLRHMINPINGDGPNLGANDGARLLQLADTTYRDHRPTVQLATVLFAGGRAYAEDGPWNHALPWLGVTLPQSNAPQPSNLAANDGGFAVLRRGSAMAMLRFPRFRFRPSQADALHLDLWLGGDNLLRDAGSFSYNTDPGWLNYFGGTASHNTVQFDDRDQMPRLSRFLFGDWLKTSFIEPLTENAQVTRFAAGYRDGHRAIHRRRTSLYDTRLRVVDEVKGFSRRAVLRWRVAPGSWRLDGQRLTNGHHVLEVSASMPIVRCELVEGWESRHYLEKTSLPVLEIEVEKPGTLTTEYRWTA
ncbi:heparinase II/III-family protein [Variovorax sp. dw_308]|uniref:heparinase II/III family protein n=1 Tax=Variovorax sp. dw_308 TaxID=2721546 RepID=UPI001C4530CA|nr:heparinase II/III-family protein [Variovorax sp. dw_308]